MVAEQTLKEGNLDAALRALQDEVRRAPADAKKRVFLFQLLAVLGEWQRALTQLQVLAELDAGALPMVHTYREAIRCELLREQVFAGKATPLVFGEPQRWLALLLEALKLTVAGHGDRAAAMREDAFALAPATPGTINGEPFAWIADADPRLGPVIEAVVNGAYYWIAFDRIREIRIGEPEDLRDVVWLPAEFGWTNGGQSVGLIPVRYPGSATSADPAIRLARRTDWQEVAPGLFHGFGQRMLTTDAGDYALLDVRLIGLPAGGTGAAADTAADTGADSGGNGDG